MVQKMLIYATRRRRKNLAKEGIDILAEYDEFVLARVNTEQAERLAAQGYELEPYGAATPGDAHAFATATPRNGPRPQELGGGEHYYLVTFVGPIKQEWLAEIAAHGGRPQEPEPPTGFVVALDEQAYDWLANEANYAQGVSHYGVDRRLSPGLLDAIHTDPLLSRGAIRDEAAGFRPQPSAERVPSMFSVRFFEPQDLAAALPKIEALGATPGETRPDARVVTVSFAPGLRDLPQRLEQLAALHGVRSIEPYVLRQLRNDVAAGLMGAGELMDPPGLGLSGRGELVGIADSGLDTGDPGTIHPDFVGRIAAIHSWPVAPAWSTLVTNVGADDGPADARSGHGTHVAGSVLGNGAASVATAGVRVRGFAFDARLVFQAIEQRMAWTEAYRNSYRRQYGRYPPDYGLAGLPADLAVLFGQAYDAGVRIHSNSWGGGGFGAYDDYAEAVDRFMWEHKDFLLLFAAGNDGADGDRDGRVDEGSVTPPGTAKNCVTVGAAESVRAEGGYQDPYGSLMPASFPLPPLRDDRLSDERSDIAAFSSRGPTQDGRIKPDVVAPGTNILSTRSSLVGEPAGWGSWPLSSHYMFNGGTSMATPLVAGAAALVREYLRTVKRRRQPSAALIKATLIHGATLLRYRHEPPGEGLYDHSQGWGHVHLGHVLAPPSPVDVRWYDQRRGLATGQSWRWACTVHDAAAPLSLTLAWTDYPAGSGTYPNLVNDLDLVLTTPSGATVYGNARTGQPGGAPDRTNNVERIVLAAPEPGRYAIRVRAFNVPRGPQDFALVYSGILA